MTYTTEAGLSVAGVGVHAATTLRTNRHLLEELREAAANDAAANAASAEEDGSYEEDASSAFVPSFLRPRRKLSHSVRTSALALLPATAPNQNNITELNITLTNGAARLRTEEDE